MAASDHGYLDGAAHQRKNAYRTSVYDTGVFVLQSRRAVGTNAGKAIAAEGGEAFRTSDAISAGSRPEKGSPSGGSRQVSGEGARGAARGEG